MDLNLTRLRRFLAIFHNRSFTRAAAELGMTHSALTKSVQTGPAVIEASLAPILAAFYKAHPDIRLSVETLPPDIAIARLRSREADLLLYHSTTVSAFPAKRTLRIAKVIDETYVAVLHPDHPALSGNHSLDEMLAFRWAIPGYDRLYRSAIPTQIEHKYRRAGFPHYRILSLSTCLALAEQCDLITLLPESFARREIRGSNLVIMPTPLADGARYVVSAITLSQDAADSKLEELIGLFA